jgi:hypothetical protein
MGHVVQAFVSWTETADVQFREVEKLPKSKFCFTPAEILGSWIQKNTMKELKDKTISKHVMTMLTAKIISDVNILSVKGIYNATTPTVLVRQWMV